MTPQQQAAAAALKRRGIRGNYHEWCKYALPSGQTPDRHHRLIIETLQRVARGELSRVMFFSPPASAKTTYVTTLFIPWYMAMYPTKGVLCCAHTFDLAEDFGGAVRKYILEHSAVLGISLSKDSQAASSFSNNQGGKFFGVGLGGAVTGRRGHLVVVDDPVKGHEAADSKSARDSAYSWFRRDLKTRLSADSDPIIIVSTRWHTEDLCGQLLDEAARTGGTPWYVVSLPAVAGENDILGRQPGEYLWPENPKYQNLLRENQASLPARDWAALYLQTPIVDGGNFFRSEWFHEYITLPPLDSMRIFATSDFAVSEQGDWTVLQIYGLAPQNKLHLLDQWRGRTSSAVWIEQMFHLHQKWKPIVWAEEAGVIKKAIDPAIVSRARQLGVYPYRESYASTRDKAARAQPIRGFLETNGGLHIPRAPWTAAFLDEALSFPAGRTDDQVDALSLAGQALGKLTAPTPELLQKPKIKVLQISDPNTQVRATIDDLWDEYENRSQYTDHRV